MNVNPKLIRPFLSFLACTFVALLFGGAFTPGEWYVGLEKPDLTPPNWLFGVVWPILYVAMAVAATRVWAKATTRGPIVLWGFQLVLNALWSWLFFGLHEPGLAFAEISLLWVAIVTTVIVFHRIDRWAALLMAPYLAWVSFAGWLNFMLWRLNV